ncbi:MAG: hypothetical protein AAF480_14080 [Actinomycetota bacterium]
MTTDAAHTLFEDACRRLFALHADGYKRPKPTVRTTASRPAVTTRVRQTPRATRVQSII